MCGGCSNVALVCAGACVLSLLTAHQLVANEKKVAYMFLGTFITSLL